MSPSLAIATAGRVLAQLRHDPRTVAQLLLVPCLLMTFLRLIYDNTAAGFQAVGAPLLALFPLITMFLVTSVALLRERTTGTLERLLTTRLGRLDLLAGYGLAFGLVAVLQALLGCAVALGPLGLELAGGAGLVVVLCVAVALLGMGLGLLASAFAATEFQVVQFMPAFVLPQLLLCGLLVPRERMPALLEAISAALPMSYAVDGMKALRDSADAGPVAGDVAIVLAFALGAVALGALTLRRRTA
jgi:ABC-2 type transport system permease protein